MFDHFFVMTDQENIPRETAQKNKSSLITIIIVAVIVSSFFGALFGFMAGSIGEGKVLPELENIFQKPEMAVSEKETMSVTEEESAVISAVEKASPAVVSIIITKDIPRMQDFFSDPFGFDPFFNPFGQGQGNRGGTETQEIGGGSGFIVTEDGLIVTNKHVVSDQSADYTVMMSNEEKYSARVMALDPTNDIAILKIEAGNNLPTVELADSMNLKIGQTVIAIGNSLGEFRNTVSKGIISGLKRNVTAGSGFGQTERLSEVIQTDAAINPGNSGGPLLNLSGEVIGVNVAMAQGAENIGFALPVNLIKKDVDSVKKEGKIVQPFLGVRYMIVTKEMQEANNLPYDYGALVLRGERVTDFAVVPGSPADKAGVTENDIILELNGTKIDENNQLGDLLLKYDVGETVSLKIWSKGQEKTIQVKLEERR